MLRQEMNRKEFLTFLTAAFGLLILNRLPVRGESHVLARHTPGSYGNDTYGGTRKA